MEPLKPFAERGTFDWEYDAEADVLYLSAGAPRKAVGVDLGEGLVVRYDESSGQVVGLTVLGVFERLSKTLTGQNV